MRGIITLATGDKRYFEMALNLAKSIRYHRPDENVCLIYDNCDMITPNMHDYFTHFQEIPSQVNARGVEFKLYVNEISPYDKTMFIDSDMLLTKNNLDDIWSMLEGKAIAFSGLKTKDGFWRVDIPTLVKVLEIEYVIRLNGGGFYFEKCSGSEDFFRYCRRIFVDHRDQVSVMHNKGFGYSVEPIFGGALGYFKVEPIPLSVEWHVSTLRFQSWDIHPTHVSITKGNGNTVTPTFAHFIGLGKNHCPNELYKDYLKSIGY
jgi:hypothetical protein